MKGFSREFLCTLCTMTTRSKITGVRIIRRHSQLRSKSGTTTLAKATPVLLERMKPIIHSRSAMLQPSLSLTLESSDQSQLYPRMTLRRPCWGANNSMTLFSGFEQYRIPIPSKSLPLQILSLFNGQIMIYGMVAK